MAEDKAQPGPKDVQAEAFPAPADEIPLNSFRQIYHWPLILEPAPEKGERVKTRIAKTREVLKSRGWAEKDPLGYPPKSTEGADGGGYSEFVYFHDFVQKFLYSPGGKGGFSLHERKDITGLKAKIGDHEYEFRVDRLSLHLFDMGVAMLTLEIIWTNTEGKLRLTLAEAQKITDYLRRSYTPFWAGETPMRVPEYVQLCGDKEHEPSKPYCEARATKYVKEKNDAKVFAHWNELIRPLKLLADDGEWRDPSDERIPVMSYISLTGAAETDQGALALISGPDWERIADAEEPGSAGKYPYNPDFLAEIRKDSFYDRFFPHEKANDDCTTRHVFGGAHYAAVGAGGFFDDILIHHFRRHYAQLALIARFEKAALLNFSRRLTIAVETRDAATGGEEAAREAFITNVLKIQGDFLSYTHRFHFIGVSSQDQGAEMYERWRKVLALDALYADVKAEIESAANYLRAERAEKSAAEAERAATEAEKLSAFAAIGVMLGLTIGAMGMGFLTGDGGLFARCNLSGVGQFGSVLAATSIISALMFTALRRLRDWRGWPLVGIALVFAAIGIIVLISHEWFNSLC